ncbi:18315_t:CDS:1 [Gigaspora margarita]|uniref:18315_t:CDS:1 n=1 Tax=Gigaspora margarita TaxID=4874 RepID=A0ABN7WG82_GIGMA|nr:18315_t:CDS:1 [Gigaspora margarita]
MKFDSSYTIRDLWIYTINNFRDSYTNKFALRTNSGEWHILDTMGGFRIAIKQILRFNITGWRGWIMKKLKLIKLFPTMAHTLEISFDKINNFEPYFAKLNEIHVKQKVLNILENDNLLKIRKNKKA